MFLIKDCSRMGIESIHFEHICALMIFQIVIILCFNKDQFLKSSSDFSLIYARTFPMGQLPAILKAYSSGSIRS